VDVQFTHAGQRFCWNGEKALSNFEKHDVKFEQACEIFLDPFVRFLNATADDEVREAVIGLTEDWTLLFVVHVVREHDVIRIVSARPATRAERRIYEDEPGTH
jgi:uncharacterized DUF497 family protein